MARLSLIAVTSILAACSKSTPRTVEKPATDSTVSPSLVPTTLDTGPVVLFAARTGHDSTAYLDPIGILSGDTLVDPPIGEPGHAPTDSFNLRWYGRGQRYRLFRLGAQIGTILALNPQEPGCAGLSADALVEPGSPLDGSGAVATNSRVISSRSAPSRPTTAADTQAILRLAQLLLPDSVPLVLRQQLAVRTLRALTLLPQPTPALVAALGARDDSNGAERVLSLFVVAEWSGDRYQATLVALDYGLEASMVSRDLLDVIDIDSNGTQEIITDNSYYESSAYTVFRRFADGWRPIYSGGGGGC